jgi:hypothetical protein
MLRVISLLLSYCLISPFPAYPWWESGHQAIARLAANHLTPQARGRIAEILGVENTPEIVAEALAAASTWADETKAETKTGNWHFIDLALQDQKSDIPARCPGDNCAPARIRLFAVQLGSRHAVDSRWSNLDALRYVVHLVGDIHQPLHTISDADLGGNCEQLEPNVGNAKNLHALWDGPLVDALDSDSRALAEELEQSIEQMAPANRSTLAAGNQDDWVWESHELAMKVIYEQLRIPAEAIEFPANCNAAPEAISTVTLDISNSYINAMRPVVRDQLIKAGLRLARVLNDTSQEWNR